MNFLENVKGSVSAAVESINVAAQNIVEKNRIQAQLNRLRLVIKNESDLINRAYISIGKFYYNAEKNLPNEPVSLDQLYSLIDSSKERIEKAKIRYQLLVADKKVQQTDNIDTSDIEDITVACSNEAEYKQVPFSEKIEEIKEDVKDMKPILKESARDIAKNAKETAKDVGKSVSEFVEDTSEEIAETTKKVVTEIKESAEESDLF